MTISSTTNRNDYTGTSSLDVYAYTFRILAQSDLLVTVRNTSDVETTLTINTDYTVSGVGSSGGGNVTLVNGSQAWLTAGNLTTGYVLTIRRVRPLTQSTDIRNQGTFYPEGHEDAFDHLVMIDQQQQDEIDRSVKISETANPADIDTTIPFPSAGLAIGWNQDEDGLVNIASLGGVTVSNYAETVLDDTTAGAARTTLDAAQKVVSCTAETAPAADDVIGLVDVSDSNAENKITLENLFKVINGITADTTPALADSIVTYDASASAAKKVLLSNLVIAPTIQKFLTGSGTYTLPTSPRSPLYIRVRMVGGGGGGGSSGTGSTNSGTAGGNSTFGTTLLVANGGSGGTAGSGTPGAGGSASLGTGPIGLAYTGAAGQGAGVANGAADSVPGGMGGVSGFGGAGIGATNNTAGGAAVTNSGSGGGGGASQNNSSSAASGAGTGGGAGGYVDALIYSPSATYAYAVGAAGAGGAAGTLGRAGGNGAEGIIIVEEYYQ